MGIAKSKQGYDEVLQNQLLSSTLDKQVSFIFNFFFFNFDNDDYFSY